MEYEIVAGWVGTVFITPHRKQAIDCYNYTVDHTNDGVVLFRNGEPFMEQMPDNFYSNGEE